MSKAGKTIISFGPSHSQSGLIIMDADLGIHKKDGKGIELWWFGSDPPDGIPEPAVFLEAIKKHQLRQFSPPWAAIVYDPENQRSWLCTDPIGLHHLFVRTDGKNVVVGPNCLGVAAADRVSIDPVAAYELLARGNPQGGRTLFSQVKSMAPATLIECNAHQVKWTRYWWPPAPEPIDAADAIERYASAVKAAVIRHFRNDEAQELTAGRDSLMILATLVHEGVMPTTWTHGERNSPDLIGASKRARKMGVRHVPIRLEPLLSRSPEDYLKLVKSYLMASSGQADAVRYGYLPWVLEQLDMPGSITGVGGEVFRGFYYQWIGKKYLPRSIGKFMMLHGKVKAGMPIPNPVIKSEIAKLGNKVIFDDVYGALANKEQIWHSLDVYYLMSRMHYFAGTTFSAVSHWKKVRMPLFDPNVLDCLSIIPINLRGWSGGLVKEITNRMLTNKDAFQGIGDFSYETPTYRIKRLLKRAAELRGSLYKGFAQLFARLVFSDKAVDELLHPRSMVSAGLYNLEELSNMMKEMRAGKPITSVLGGILTIEMAARTVGDSVTGVEHP